ncbi:aspartyl protease family protein [Salmonella enterica]|nr:aspartyl protease family protein [Salmonella enterica]
MFKKIIHLFLIFPSISGASAPEVLSYIRYDAHDMPFVDLNINGRVHSMQIDTGSNAGLHIYEHQLKKIISSPTIKIVKKLDSTSVDITGKTSRTNSYILNSIRISGVDFYNVEAVNFVPWGYSTNGEVPHSEVLGLGLFFDKKIFLNFKDNYLSLLKNLPFETTSWSKYEFSVTSSGVTIDATSNGRKYKLVVDTGASNSMLFSKPQSKIVIDGGCSKIFSSVKDSECSVAKVKIKDTNNHQKSTYAMVVDVDDNEIDFDGLIGMDVLKDHKVIFDMPSRNLYISRY